VCGARSCSVPPLVFAGLAGGALARAGGARRFARVRGKGSGIGRSGAVAVPAPTYYALRPRRAPFAQHLPATTVCEKRARVRYPHLHAWSSFLSRPITGPVVPPRTPAARATQVESNTWFKVVSAHLSGALNLAAEACEPGQTATGLCGKFGNPAKHGVR
jgi:hypothetical protein